MPLPDDMNPLVVDALATLLESLTGLKKPPREQFPPEWHPALREFYSTVKRIALEQE